MHDLVVYGFDTLNCHNTIRKRIYTLWNEEELQRYPKENKPTTTAAGTKEIGYSRVWSR